VALVLAVLVLVLLALAQVLLPRVAANRVRARVAPYGQVRSVHVSAFPAVELLWGRADSVSVSAAKLAATTTQIASLLWQARGAEDMDVDADVGVLHAPLLARALEVGAVHVRKRGASVSAVATLTQKQLADALPAGVSVEPIASGSGAVEARVSGGLFGLQASLNVLVRAVDGNLTAEPRGLPFGGIAAVTLFSDPHLKVLGVAMRVLQASPLSYEVTLNGRLS
jgi:hypothetical protein